MKFLKKISIKQAALILVQIAFIGFWFIQLNKFELFSKTGDQYSKYNGIYFLCGIASILCMWDNAAAGSLQTRREQIATWVCSVLYALATVLANYPAFEPFDQPLNLIRFVLALVGGFIVAFHTIKCGLRRLPLSVKMKPRTEGHPSLVYWGAFVSTWAVYLLYFFFVAYPGYFTRDSFSAIGQCLTGNYDNVSPFWHTMVVKASLEIGAYFGGSGNSAVCVYGILQSLFMAAVFAYAVVTLWQSGAPRWCVAIVYGMYTFMTYNLAYSATMWKDVPFSLAALIIVCSLYRILSKTGKRMGLNYAVFALGGFVFCLMRTNGWYSLLITAVILLLVLRENRKKMLILLCAVLATAWIFNNPVLDAIGVSGSNFVEGLAVPFQQISRVVADDCEISESDMEMLEEIFWVDRMEELYDPLTVDPIKFQAFRHANEDYLRQNIGDYTALWIRLGVQHPWTYLKAWIDETQGYWNAGYHYCVYPEGESDELGIVRPVMDNPVADVFAKWFHFLEATPPITQPLYGIGFQVWLLIFCFVVNAVKKREEALLAVPALVLIVGLWLGTPLFAEFRYAYPVFLTVPFLLCFTLFGGKEAGMEAN